MNNNSIQISNDQPPHALNTLPELNTTQSLPHALNTLPKLNTVQTTSSVNQPTHVLNTIQTANPSEPILPVYPENKYDEKMDIKSKNFDLLYSIEKVNPLFMNKIQMINDIKNQILHNNLPAGLYTIDTNTRKRVLDLLDLGYFNGSVDGFLRYFNLIDDKGVLKHKNVNDIIVSIFNAVNGKGLIKQIRGNEITKEIVKDVMTNCTKEIIKDIPTGTNTIIYGALGIIIFLLLILILLFLSK
jgi:hypothetical protein